jgi:hypothetical protein
VIFKAAAPDIDLPERWIWFRFIGQTLEHRYATATQILREVWIPKLSRIQ